MSLPVRVARRLPFPNSEPAMISSIEVTLDQYLAARIDFSKTNLQANQYKIYLNGKEVTKKYWKTDYYYADALLPNQNYNVIEEAYSNGNLIARGSTGFNTPFICEDNFDNYKTREGYVTFIYDKSLSLVRMIIPRTAVIVENGEAYEDPSTTRVVQDGAPINLYTETEFKFGIVKYIYHVVNYQNGSMVGEGILSVSNYLLFILLNIKWMN